MGLLSQMFALVRGRTEAVLDQPGGSTGALAINPRGDLLVAQGMSPLAEIVRMRNSYQVIASSAVAPVTALPTTAALMSLYNNEQDGGKIYIVDSIFATVVVSAGAATQLGMAAMLNIGPKTAPTPTALTIRGLAGQGSKSSAIIVAGASSLTDDSWQPVGNSVVGPASQICMNVDVPVNGLFIVPPKHYFHVSAIANTAATITVRCGFRWHEVQLPIG